MLQLFIAAFLSLAAPAPVEASPFTGDVAKDTPIVCMMMVAEKVDNAMNDRPVVSVAIPAYSAAYKLSKEQTEKLEQDCAMFEFGFMVGVNAERKGLLTKPVEVPETKGLTT